MDYIIHNTKMSNQYQKGGQRRTIETGCGWRCVGHPTEVNKKYILHKKYCKDCGDNNTDKLPEWNKEAGLMNGWKGLTNKGQQPKQMLTTAFVEGIRQDIHLKDIKCIEDAMNDAKLLVALLADNIIPQTEPVLTKSQKKRQKQKDKKVKLCSNCNELQIAPNRKCFDDWCERCDEALYSTKEIEQPTEKEIEELLKRLA